MAACALLNEVCRSLAPVGSPVQKTCGGVHLPAQGWPHYSIFAVERAGLKKLVEVLQSRARG